MQIRDRVKELRRVRAGDLVPNPKNWRTHPQAQQDALRGILAEVGYADALLARELPDGSLMLVDGHLRAETTPEQEVPVLVLDIDQAEADKLLLSLDPLAALAETNSTALDALLREVDTGSEGLQQMYADLAEAAELYQDGDKEIVEDEIPEPPADPITKPGDLWLLGDHRLLCGDSIDRENIAKLFASESADFILTDPPYCSGGFQESKRTVGSTDGIVGKKIARDNLTTEGLASLLEMSIGRIPCEGACYVFCDWRQLFAVRRVVEPLGYQYRALLIWDKGSPGMGGPWRHSYEMAYFGTKRKEPSVGKSGDVIKCKRTGNDLHTTQKPVELMAAIIDNTVGQLIADPFCGSGTTLIAAEQLGRKCYGMEISPAYCDVIVKRWETLTGKKATREETNGQARTEAAAEQHPNRKGKPKQAAAK